MRMNRRRVVSALLLLLAVCPSTPPAAAQSVSFTSDVGLMVFTVRADSATAFEDLLQRLAVGLKAAARSNPSNPAVGLRILRSGQAPAADQRLFLILIEPVVAAQDYSIDRLLELALPDHARSLSAQVRAALADVPPFVADLSVLHAISPDDVMRSRLEAELVRQGSSLGLPPEAGRADPSVAAQLERLRLPIWKVEAVQYRAVETTGAEWRFAWSCDVVNASLSGPATAELAVSFVASDGAVVATVRSSVFGVPAGGRRTVSGEARIASIAASRVVAARVSVLSGP